MDSLSKIIRKFGLSMPEFCDKILNTDYKAFRARVRKDRLRLSEIKLIIIYTKRTFEQLFMDGVEVKADVTSTDKPIEPLKRTFIDTWGK